VTFIDAFLTPDFCRRHQMFSFKYNDQRETYEIESREFKKIKDRLLFGLTNFGQPIIRVKDGNYRNRGELYLQQEHFGIDLRLDHSAGHPAPPPPPLDAAGPPGDQRRRAAHPLVLRRVGSHHPSFGRNDHEPESKDRRRA
jgi:stage V sporulation protein R